MNDNIISFSGGSRPGRGGDGGSNLEARVAKLESGVDHIERDVAELRTDMRDVRDRLARLEERVSNLPGKGFIVTSVVVLLTVLTSAITFQQRIQAVIGTIPATQADLK